MGEVKRIELEAKEPRFRFDKREIIFHGAICVYVVINWFQISLRYGAVNSPVDTQASFLTPWIGLERNSHDPQWQGFRSGLLLLVGYAILGRLIKPYFDHDTHSCLTGGLLALVAFRSEIIFYLAILSLWFLFVQRFATTRHFVKACWAIMILTLFFNERTSHFKFFSDFLEDFIPLSVFKPSSRLVHYAQIINMAFLRMISYAVDYHKGSENSELAKHEKRCSQCSEKAYCLKARGFIDCADFSFKSYMSYVLFCPLLLTGPPGTYKTYHSFKKFPSQEKPAFLRWAIIVIVFQFYQHLFPVYMPAATQTLLEAETLSLLHLIFIWFKFLVIWRSGLVWSQWYGVDAFDNMSRCICNNYSFEGFWRMWHRGFNQWLIRYLYLPLGGSKSFFSIVPVVGFVCFWHDHKPSILLWGLIIVLMMIPEILVKSFSRAKLSKFYPTLWFKYVAAFAASFNIFGLVICNVIGFGFGTEEASAVLSHKWYDLGWLLLSLVFLTCICIIMFYARHLEGYTKNY